MMNAAEFARRMRLVLPDRWFADEAPVLDAVLQSMGATWAALHDQLMVVRDQARLATVSESFLDLAALDFAGATFLRKPSESDASFRDRLTGMIFREKVTRVALTRRLFDLTGHTPRIFEPSRPADTGGWGVACGWGVAEGWGSLSLPYQVFVQVDRPAGKGIPNVAGWGSPVGGWGVGALSWTALSDALPHVTDTDIYAAVADTLPAGVTGWVSLGGVPIGGQAPLGEFAFGFNELA